MKKIILIGVYCLAILIFNISLYAEEGVYATVSIASVDDPTLEPGSIFTAEIWADATDMWGFQVGIKFDPAIIQCLDYQVNEQEFPYPWPSWIDNSYGAVYVAASKYFGTWFGANGHVLLVTLYFQVVAKGASELTFIREYTEAVDIYGNVILNGSYGTLNDGYFSNTPPAKVELVKRAAWPEQKWTHSGGKGVPQELFAMVRNFSNTTSYKVMVRFIVTTQPQNKEGSYELYTDMINLKPGATEVVSVARDFLPGMYLVIAQALYSVDGVSAEGGSASGGNWRAGGRIKRFGFPVLK